MVRAVPVSADGQELSARPSYGFADATGAYRISLTPGMYYLTLEPAPGLAVFFPGVLIKSEAGVVTVGDSSIENLNITLPLVASGVRVAGRIQFPANYPPPSAKLTARLISRDAGEFEGPVGSDGVFVIDHVQRGSYAADVVPIPGMQSVPVLVADKNVSGIELTVPRLVPVSGKVTMENGGPRPAFPIAIEGPVYRTRVAVAADGVFRTNLPEGEYSVMLSLKGYYIKSLESSKKDLQTETLKITPTDNSVAIDITLASSAGVHAAGHIRPSANSSTVARTLALAGRATAETAEAAIAPDGSFEIPKLMPGSYVARVILSSGLSARTLPVVIPNRDLSDLEIEIPPEVEVRGHVEVDGYGPPPQFSLTLVSGANKVDFSQTDPQQAAAAMMMAARSGTNGEFVRMNVNALPDGSFKMKLPEGTYQVMTTPGIAFPPAYVLHSINYGQADLLAEPMMISADRSAELQIGIGTTVPNSWVAVRGKVNGLDPANGPVRVSLESNVTSAIEALAGPDGSFEFPRVLPRTTYTARVVPANDAASAPRVAVADKDVTGIEILVPAEKEVRIVTSMDDNTPAPVFVLTLAGSGSTVSITVKPERDGSFRAKLPIDERRVQIGGFPLGYALKSATYATTDLRKQPLKTSKNDADEMQVTFGPDPLLPFGSLKGRITGIEPSLSGIQLSLNSATSFSTFETGVGPDGSFSFSKIPQGTYVPTLMGAGVSGVLTPSTITVSGTDVFSVELAAAVGRSTLEALSPDDEPAGVVLSSLVGSRQAANESGAVSQLRTINTAEVTYLSGNGGRYGTIADMVAEGLLDERFKGEISGFTFAVIAAGPNYVVAAIPVTQSTGRYGYFSTTDAVIRYSTIESLTLRNEGGRPVR
jgi:hypothetical protein